MFWVISVYFNIRNTLPNSGTFLLGHPVYFPSPMLSVPNSTTSQLHGHKEENHKKLWTPVTWDENHYKCDHPAPHTKHEQNVITQPHTPTMNTNYSAAIFSILCGITGSWGMRWNSWLRHCATSRKVASSIPNGVIGIYH